jgi:3-oxoacyl-[acyl-carrier protein] reductase
MPSRGDPIWAPDLLAGQVAVVTGASGGIGEAIARMLDEAGASVVCVAGRNLAKAQELAGTLQHPALALSCDVTDEASVKAVVDATVAEFGHLDILVNNAGIMYELTLEDTDLEHWQKTIDANLTSNYLFCRLAKPALMASGRGCIVIMSSRLGVTGWAGAAAYAATKAGLYGLMKSLAREYAPHIRVNAVAPGPITSPMTDVYSSDPEWMRRKTSTIPMGRLGRPEEVAAATVFLASDKASGFLTGQTIHPNGGGAMV